MGGGWRCWPRHYKWINPSLIARQIATTTMAPMVSEMMMQLKHGRDLGLVILLDLIAPPHPMIANRNLSICGCSVS
jgi:hypothetical protein